MTDKTPAAPRRKFLKGAATAVGAAGAMATPMIAVAQTTSFRFQSTWPAKDIFHEYANDFAKKVNDMAGGRVKIEVLPSGAVVPAFQLLEAVNKGTLDGGHGVVAYHYGKNNALALWGSGPAFGMDPNMVLAWHNYGGGKALLEEIYKTINMDVVSYLYGPMPTQPLGWFKKPVAKVDDMKGLKFRTVGLSVDIFTALGTAVNPLPGSDIVPALDRGLIDAAEFNNASSDRALGFQDVAKNCMLQSFHQSGEPVRDPVQQDEVQRPVAGAEVDHRLRGPGRQRRHELEGDRSQLAGLHRAEEGRRQVLQDARCGAARPARRLGQDRRRQERRESAVQEGDRLAEGLRRARRSVAERLHGRLQDGVQPHLQEEGLIFPTLVVFGLPGFRRADLLS
jgi:TRAP-type mannitol/chloroaromatic compound transport system substrate-binding protein